jgi:hypothetical protein
MLSHNLILTSITMMPPHQHNFPKETFPTFPTFECSSSYVPQLTSSSRYQSRALLPSPFTTCHERATPTEQNKFISSATGLSKPHLSSDSNGSINASDEVQARSVVPLTFDQVLSKLTPLLDGITVAGERKISIKGVSAEIVNKLWEKGDTSELGLGETQVHSAFSFFYFTSLKNSEALISLMMG